MSFASIPPRKHLKQVSEVFRLHLNDPVGAVEKALEVAGKQGITTGDAGWDTAVLVRREIRKALDDLGLNAGYIAKKLKSEADKGNLKAIDMICRMRGYNDPLPKYLPPSSPIPSHEREQRARTRIIEVLNLKSYPVGDAHDGGAEEANPEGEGVYPGAEGEAECLPEAPISGEEDGGGGATGESPFEEGFNPE